ncbi:MAG: SDR family oxidoreductase [Burkholderiales bacterium]|nr:SDR family oxidoreductase [Burkholderiales bacterium]
MLKRMALLTRKPGMSREEFHHHWNTIHGPLVASHPNVVRYLQDNVLAKERFVERNADPANPLPPGHMGPEVDGIVELWYESREQMEAMYASPLAKELQADALKHIGTITTFVVEERTVVDRRPAPKGLLLSLAGERVLVTGAGSGIGAALARGCARAGAAVVVTDLDLGKARETVAQIAAMGGVAEAHALDVTDRAACGALAATLSAQPISRLINNAGIAIAAPLGETATPAAWDRMWNVNAGGVFNVTHAFLPQLKATRGAILNLSSVAARAARNRNTAYQSSKAAITQMTRGWAVELADAGVRVNALAPGIIATPLSAHTRRDPEKVARTLTRVPMGRVAEPDELASAAVFLLSREATYITGVVLPVDGGFDAT